MRRIENSLLIRSSMILLVTRIAIKSWMSVNFARLGRRTSELLALECGRSPQLIVTNQGSHRPGKVLEIDLGRGKPLEFENSAICPGIL